VAEIERHPVEITPATLELLRHHGRMIAEIAAQFARDRAAEGGGDVVGYFQVGPNPHEAVGATYARDIEKTIVWRHGEMTSLITTGEFSSYSANAPGSGRKPGL